VNLYRWEFCFHMCSNKSFDKCFDGVHYTTIFPSSSHSESWCANEWYPPLPWAANYNANGTIDRYKRYERYKRYQRSYDTTDDTNGIKTIRYQNNIDARIMWYVTYHYVKTIQIFSPAVTIGYRNIDRRALYEKQQLILWLWSCFYHMHLQTRGGGFSSNV